ncbi:MAG: AtpZ/AtpI family protein [Methanoregula sp.]|nr:AtpZ/AtpI family protein [Methanoregula sp.]
MSIDRECDTLYTIGEKFLSADIFIPMVDANNNLGNNKDKNIKDINSTKETPFWQPALLMFSRLSGWIIGPIILGIFIGKWLDNKYDTAPWLFLASVGVAFIISMIGLVRDALKEIDKFK